MTSAPSPDTGGEVAAYAAEVRAALADVPEAQVADLLEDLEEHLAEVAADGDGTLVSRLGPPARYAEELRRSAGLPEPGGDPPAGRRARVDVLAARARTSRPVREVLDFLPELRPAWWVARAWLGLLALDRILLGSTSFPLPTFGLGPVLGLLLTAAAVVFSVRLGRRAQAHPRSVPQPVAWAGNGLLALLAVVALAGGAGDSPETSFGDPAFASGGTTLAHEDGTPITNLHPYSSTGEPLSGVLLYDQDGRPVDNLAEWTTDGLPVERVVTDRTPPPPSNAYPQQQRIVDRDEWGEPVPAPFPPPAVLPGPVTTSPGTTPAPGPTSSPGTTQAPGPTSEPGTTPGSGATPTGSAPSAPVEPSPTPGPGVPTSPPQPPG